MVTSANCWLNNIQVKITCYEPTPALLSEAQQNLNTFTKIEFCQNLRQVMPKKFEIVFCLEVFEHLPPEETTDALQQISDLLKPGGVIVIGVPIEIRVPALYKGIFRMLRRYGTFDANIKNVALAVLGKPPKNRSIHEITPGFKFHFEHMGFTFVHFKKTLSNYFQLRKVATSLFSVFGSWLMPEIYFIAEKVNKEFQPIGKE